MTEVKAQETFGLTGIDVEPSKQQKPVTISEDKNK